MTCVLLPSLVNKAYLLMKSHQTDEEIEEDSALASKIFVERHSVLDTAIQKEKGRIK